MRIRRIVLTGLLTGAVVLAAAAPAAAAEDHAKELTECVVEGLEENGLVEEGQVVDFEEAKTAQFEDFDTALENCKKSQSLFTPALPEIIWGGIAFLIVLFALVKFAFPALKKGLKAREDKIRGDLEGAEKARVEAEAERDKYLAQLGDARTEANKIVEEARQAAERVRQDMLTKAEADAAEVRERANEDIRLARDRAIGDLQRQVGDLSIELAEKIVERSIDPATQQDLVESYISSVGGSNQ
jgi:F-type H+-transporting ATPase subunit b